MMGEAGRAAKGRSSKTLDSGQVGDGNKESNEREGMRKKGKLSSQHEPAQGSKVLIVREELSCFGRVLEILLVLL